MSTLAHSTSNGSRLIADTLGNLMADDDIFETFPENERDCAHIAVKK